MPVLEQRYAEALAELAVQKNEVENFLEQLRSLAEAFRSSEDFRRLLAGSEIDKGQKKTIIKNALGSRVSPTVLNFLLLLVDKGRAEYLPGIYEEFVHIIDEMKGILKMTVISAFPLTGMQIDTIKRKYMKLYDAKAAVTNLKIDPSLLGGVKVKIGDRVMDASVSGQLEGLKEWLQSAAFFRGDANEFET